MQSNDSEKQPKLESGLQAALDELQEIDAHWDPNTSPDHARKALDQLESILKESPNTAQLIQIVLPRILAANKAMDMVTYILSKLVTECKRQEDDGNTKLIGAILENILKMKGLVEGLPFCFAAGIDWTDTHYINKDHMSIIANLLAPLPNRYEIFAMMLAHPIFVFKRPQEGGIPALTGLVCEALSKIPRADYLALAKALIPFMGSDEPHKFGITEELTYLWLWLIQHKNPENERAIPLIRAMIMTQGNYASAGDPYTADLRVIVDASIPPLPDFSNGFREITKKYSSLSRVESPNGIRASNPSHPEALLEVLRQALFNGDKSVTSQCFEFIKELTGQNPKRMALINQEAERHLVRRREWEKEEAKERLVKLSKNPEPNNVQEAKRLFEFLVANGGYRGLIPVFYPFQQVIEVAHRTIGDISFEERIHHIEEFANVLMAALATDQIELAKVFLQYIATTEKKTGGYPVLIDTLGHHPVNGWRPSALEMIEKNPEMLLFMDSDPAVSPVFTSLRLSRLKQNLEGKSGIFSGFGEDNLLSSCPVRSDDPRVKERLFTMLKLYLLGMAGAPEPSNDKKAEVAFKLFRERGLSELANFLTLRFTAPNPDIGELLKFELGGFPNDVEILSLADADPARVAAIVDNINGVNLLSIALGSQQTDLVKVILRTAVTVEAGLEDMADALSEEQKAQVSEIIQKDPELIVILPLQQLVQKREKGDTTGCAIM